MYPNNDPENVPRTPTALQRRFKKKWVDPGAVTHGTHGAPGRTINCAPRWRFDVASRSRLHLDARLRGPLTGRCAKARARNPSPLEPGSRSGVASRNHLFVGPRIGRRRRQSIRGRKWTSVLGGLLNLPTPALDRRPRHAQRLRRAVERQAADLQNAIDRHPGSRSPEAPALRPGAL
jgi:hypothetical protein